MGSAIGGESMLYYEAVWVGEQFWVNELLKWKNLMFSICDIISFSRLLAFWVE